MEIEHEGIGIEVTFNAKRFHNWAFRLITLANIKHSIFQKLLLLLIIFFICVCGTKKSNNYMAKKICPFFPWLLNINNNDFATSLNYYSFKTNNFECAFCT
jgi:hypothetical protein